jgi:hypothetical protein
METRRTRSEKSVIYGRRELPLDEGSYSATEATATWATIAPVGSRLLIRALDVGWTQCVSRVYEIGSQRTYMVAGRPNWRWAMGQVVAPHRLGFQFSQTFAPSPQKSPLLECLPTATQVGSRDRQPHAWVMSGTEIAGVGIQTAGVVVTIQSQLTGFCDQLKSRSTP